MTTEQRTTVFIYHERTKHHLHHYARSLGYLDWATQPDPFRRYEGAELLPLDEVPPTPEPCYDDLFVRGRVPVRPLNAHTIAQFFYDSLALSAWKEYRGERWSLRVNPSSGNLHPTEGYLLAGPLAGLREQPALYHYAPFEHGLEVRADLTPHDWQALTAGLPAGAFLVGLTSIYWRESWKYGERAFRYCQHDVGHAIGAIALAAAALGWEARLLESVTDAELAVLLGVQHQAGIEAEHPDCLLAISPHGQEFPPERQRAYRPPPDVLAWLEHAPLRGRPNRLSSDHHEWPIIDEVAAATRRTQPPDDGFWHAQPPAQDSSGEPRAIPARQIIRQRRSAVDMDARTSITRAQFYRMLQRVVPATGPTPFTTLPWRPFVHLALFVHRVQDLPPGLYLLVRDPAARNVLRAELGKTFAWSRPPECPTTLDLSLLVAADARQAAQVVSCHQAIAADGAFSLGMLAEFELPLNAYGPWLYKRLFWETGVIGQVLYLEAEAAGIRATGIGCFFDDAMHQILGLASHRYQSLYHFTVGGPIDDPRLRTAPPYAHRQARPATSR